VALAGLLLAPGALWADPPAGRAKKRERVDSKVEKLEARLLAVPEAGADNPFGNPDRTLAEAQLEMARRFLARGEERAAREIAGLAERSVARAEERAKPKDEDKEASR
jgi:hypothetical protein